MTSFGLGGDPRFCSYKQDTDRGWQVRKGERGTTVFFFKRMLVEDRNAPADAADRTKAVPLLRAYTVFNGSQIDGIPAYVAPDWRDLTWERPEAADVILRNSGAVVRFGGNRAFYSPSQDFIQLPEPASFHTPQDFAATALHEAAHMSGSKQRLDRDLTGRFGSAAYAQEELRAELSSCFIGSILNLPYDIPNHANYVASWAAKLREDKREIFRAAADAQRIADYLLAFHPDYAASVEAAPPEDDVSPAPVAPGPPSWIGPARRLTAQPSPDLSASRSRRADGKPSRSFPRRAAIFNRSDQPFAQILRQRRHHHSLADQPASSNQNSSTLCNPKNALVRSHGGGKNSPAPLWTCGPTDPARRTKMSHDWPARDGAGIAGMLGDLPNLR